MAAKLGLVPSLESLCATAIRPDVDGCSGVNIVKCCFVFVYSVSVVFVWCSFGVLW